MSLNLIITDNIYLFDNEKNEKRDAIKYSEIITVI